MTDNENSTNKSGLQRLHELAPALRASTERLKTHNDHLAAQQDRTSQTMLKPSAWGTAVDKLRGTNNG